MLSLFADGKPIDYHSTADRLQQQGAYEASGGLLYLSELNLATPSAAHIEHYGRIVERTSIMRQLIAKAQTIAEIAYRDNLDPDTALEKAEQLILSVAEKRVTRDFRSLEDVLTEYMEQIEALQDGEATRYGIPTGYMDLDKLLGGFQRTDLIILAARTSVGKTSFRAEPGGQRGGQAQRDGGHLQSGDGGRAARLAVAEHGERRRFAADSVGASQRAGEPQARRGDEPSGQGAHLGGRHAVDPDHGAAQQGAPPGGRAHAGHDRRRLPAAGRQRRRRKPRAGARPDLAGAESAGARAARADPGA